MFLVGLGVLLLSSACGKKTDRRPTIPAETPTTTVPTPTAPTKKEDIHEEEIAPPETDTAVLDEDLDPPIIVEPEPELPSDFDVAEERFMLQDYPVAVEFYESYLDEFPEAENADAAFFKLAVSHCLKDSPLYSYNLCRELLGELILKYPESNLSTSASLLLSRYNELDKLQADLAVLRAEFDKLVEELEKLKSIDLRKRKESPPKRR
jgi:hypothetical protein